MELLHWRKVCEHGGDKLHRPPVMALTLINTHVNMSVWRVVKCTHIFMIDESQPFLSLSLRNAPLMAWRRSFPDQNFILIPLSISNFITESQSEILFHPNEFEFYPILTRVYFILSPLLPSKK